NQQQTLKLQAPTSRGNRSQVSDCTVVQRISQLCGICASVQDSNFSGPLTVHDLLNQSSVYGGGCSARSVKMYWLSQEVQCFRVDPINKQATMGAARRYTPKNQRALQLGSLTHNSPDITATTAHN